jgi:hypothetical protein
VAFSRDYLPLWRISNSSQVVPADPWEWIDFTDQQFWWDDADTPWGRSAKAQSIERKMLDLHVTGVPPLMNAVQVLICGRTTSIKGAVRQMMPLGLSPHRYLSLD